jgi:hypothetical protein
MVTKFEGRLMMKLKFFVIAVVWLSCYLTAQAQSKPCSCTDKKDLMNRLNVVEMAIQEYRAQIEVIKEQEKNEGKHLMWTQKRYDNLEENVNNAMKTVRDPSANSASAKSNGGDCDFEEITAPTDCLRESVTRHEKVHHRACLAVKDSLGLTETYQMRMRLADFAQEEIFAYFEERKFILSQLQSLPPNCRPNNWFGYVANQRVVTTVINKTIPPINANGRPSAGISVGMGGTSTQISKNSYTGTILVEEGKAARAKGYAAESYDESRTVTGRVYCSPKKPDMSQVDTSGRKDFVEGTAEGNAEFRLSVHPAKGKYYIQTGFFSVIGAGQTSNFSTTSGGCGDNSINRDFPVTNKRLGGGKDYRIEEELKGSPDYLEGSKIEKPDSGNSSSQEGNISINRTEVIQVRWMLRRLPTQ